MAKGLMKQTCGMEIACNPHPNFAVLMPYTIVIKSSIVLANSADLFKNVRIVCTVLCIQRLHCSLE